MHAFDVGAIATAKVAAGALAGVGRLILVVVPVYHEQKPAEARPRRVGRDPKPRRREREIDHYLVRVSEGGHLLVAGDAAPQTGLVREAEEMAAAINAIIVPMVRDLWAPTLQLLHAQTMDAQAYLSMVSRLGQMEEANRLGVTVRGALVVASDGALTFTGAEAAQAFCDRANNRIAPLLAHAVTAYTAQYAAALAKL